MGGMNQTQSEYQTVVGSAMLLPKTTTLILPADSRRWTVRFVGAASSLLAVYPGPILDPLTVVGSFPGDLEVKWRDAPSWAPGEWYVYNDDTIALPLMWWQCLFIKG